MSMDETEQRIQDKATKDGVAATDRLISDLKKGGKK